MLVLALNVTDPWRQFFCFLQSDHKGELTDVDDK